MKKEGKLSSTLKMLLMALWIAKPFEPGHQDTGIGRERIESCMILYSHAVKSRDHVLWGYSHRNKLFKREEQGSLGYNTRTKEERTQRLIMGEDKPRARDFKLFRDWTAPEERRNAGQDPIIIRQSALHTFKSTTIRQTKL